MPSPRFRAAAGPAISLPVVVAIAALVSVAATAAVCMLAVAGAAPSDVAVNLLDDVALAFALIACAYAVRTTTGDLRKMWVFFLIGVGLWSLGEVVFDLRLLVMHRDPVQPVSDALYMSFYPLMIAGLWVRDRGLRPAKFDPRLLDSIVIALATAVIAYGLVYDNASGPEAEAIGAAGRIAYPLLDGVLIWAVVYQLYSRRVVWDATRTLLAGAVFALFGAGLIFTLVGRLESGVAVSLAMTLIGFAALACGDVQPVRQATDRPRLTHAPEIVLFLAFAGVAVIVFQHLYSANPTLVVLAGAAMAAMVLRLLTVLMQNEKLLDSSERRGSTDPLTGLANRQHFHQRLDAELARAARENGNVALLLIDLDNFKSINDIAGHNAGDKVLVTVARILRESSREFDVTCRIGGDELAVIAPEADGAAALDIADRLCRMTEAAAAGELHDLPPVTLSIGCSVYPSLAADSEQLVQTADEALYRVKRNGRAAAELYAPGAPNADGTERQLARVQTELAARDADFKAVFRHAKEAMAIFDETGKLLLVNDAATAMFGQTRERMIGRRLAHFMRAEGPTDFVAMLAELREKGSQEGRTDVVLGGADGEGRHARIEFSTSRFAPNRFLTILWDVTEEEAAGATLAENEQRFRAIFESSLDPIFVTDDEGIIRDANIAAAEMAGIPLGKLIGSPVSDLVHPEDVGEVNSRAEELRDFAGQRGTFKTRDEHDVLRSFEYSAVADFVPGLHLSIVREVTKRAPAQPVRKRVLSRGRVLR